MLRHSDILMTTHIADALACSPRTAAKLIDSGELYGWRMGIDRRTSREALETYAQAKGIPIKRSGMVVVLGPPALAVSLNSYLPDRFVGAGCLGEAGQQVERMWPSWVVLDLGWCDRGEALAWSRQLTTVKRCKVMALLAEGEEVRRIEGVSTVLVQPCDPGRIVAEVMR